jgi:hypothetical protein
MKIVSLMCGSCGAAAQVSDNTERFTCSFCKAIQVIERSNGVLVAHGLAQIQQGTDRMAAELALVRLDAERLSLTVTLNRLRRPRVLRPSCRRWEPEEAPRPGIFTSAKKFQERMAAYEQRARDRQQWRAYDDDYQKDRLEREREAEEAKKALHAVEREILRNRKLVGASEVAYANGPVPPPVSSGDHDEEDE